MANRGTLHFLDTSALVKLYHQEPGSELVEQLAADLTIPITISGLARVELHSAFVRELPLCCACCWRES